MGDGISVVIYLDRRIDSDIDIVNSQFFCEGIGGVYLSVEQFMLEWSG